MIIRRYATITAVACGLTLALVAPAAADTVSVSATGAGSNQTFVANNSSDVTVNNTNVVVVETTNDQQAKTGSVVAEKNTAVGAPVQSGNASNDNSTTTDVTISNTPVAVLPVGGSGNGVEAGGAGVIQTSGGPGGAARPVVGNVLGASTVAGLGGAAVLPAVGASVPMDVSALRNGWNSQVQAPSAALAKTSRMFTGAMLVTATLLSLLGALGSAWYARRREERV